MRAKGINPMSQSAQAIMNSVTALSMSQALTSHLALDFHRLPIPQRDG
jgi:hypothetical protein